jgi:hypothetical protein
MLHALLVGLTLQVAPAGPFPLAQEKGLHYDTKATSFRVPHELPGLEKFYREQFRGEKDVAVVKREAEKGPELTITSHRKGDTWVKAVLQDEGVTTLITVYPLVQMGEQGVNGTAPAPTVMIILPRSDHVKAELQEIDASHAPQH